MLRFLWRFSGGEKFGTRDPADSEIQADMLDFGVARRVNLYACFFDALGGATPRRDVLPKNLRESAPPSGSVWPALEAFRLFVPMELIPSPA